MTLPTLEVIGLTKAFGGAPALRGVDLRVHSGEVHAVLGPNGAGKSTLIGCLSGAVTPDAGTITVNGVTTGGFSPGSALRSGVAVIYQHFSLIGPLSASENIFLASELRRGPLIDRRSQGRRARELLARFESTIDVGAPVERLSRGEQQLVEIAKALRHDPQLLILDEPTAALGEKESTLLVENVRRLAASGMAVIYITHLLDEVPAVADAVTVLRDGEVVLTSRVHAVTRDQLTSAIAPGSRMQVGRAAEQLSTAVVLDVDNLVADRVGPITLRVHAGEVIGFYGLLGSGRTELFETLTGVRRLESGRVSLRGSPFRPASPARALRVGVALVPDDRATQSLFADLSALDNLLLPHLSTLARGGFRRRRSERTEFSGLAQRLHLTPMVPKAPAATYSGGNQQKLVLGRWLTTLADVDVLLLDEPTQGVDFASRQDVYRLLSGYVAAGERCVLFASSDPEEVLALATRAVVLAHGLVQAIVPRSSMTKHELVMLAHNLDVGAATSPLGVVT